jgi:hypothetical protein
MLTLLTKQVRGWAAGILVAAYAFGVLAPSLAFSFDSDASIIHSLTEVHGGLLMPHVHHDHGDDKNSDQRAPGGGHHCCGVLAIPGLLPPTEISIVDQICLSLVSTVPQDHRAACGPARLDRPPRHLPLI